MRWIIGDIHGMFRPLETLVREIARADADHRLYFVGDYVNRGPDSRRVIELLLSLDPLRARFIRGNHDDVLDEILHGVSYAENSSHADRFLALTWFLEHGLFETLTSYGVTREQVGRVIRERSRDAIGAIIERFPESHRQFIRTLPVFIEDDDLFVVHGKWPVKQGATPAEILGGASAPSSAVRYDALWGRFSDVELQRAKAWSKLGFFGHTPVVSYRGRELDFTPIIGPNVVLLDTAAALSNGGRLTAMCAETGLLIQSDREGRLVSTNSSR